MVLSVICSKEVPWVASDSRFTWDFEELAEDTAVGALEVPRGIGKPDDQPAQRQVPPVTNRSLVVAAGFFLQRSQRGFCQRGRT